MGEQAGGSSADEEARVAASSQPLRRSKRDSAARRKPISPRSAGAEVYTPVEASTAAPRRSQRHGAPASPAMAPVAPSASKATPTSAAARGSAIEPIALPAIATPPSQSKRRPVSRPELRAPSGSSSMAHANAAVTVMGDASVTVRTQLRKVLGRYTARECSLVCESILEHLKRQSNLPTALESEISPAHIDWREIAAYIEATHRMIISPRDCQDLWKFLAYAQTPDDAERTGDDLLASSDDEQYDWSVEEIQQRHANGAKKSAIPVQASSTGEASAPAAPEEAAPEAEAPHDAPTAPATMPSDSRDAAVPNAPTETVKTEQELSSTSTEKANAEATATVPVPPSASTVRLYPTYELPTGAPEGWEHPFQPKTMQPLTFVAEKFLKRKPYPTQPASVSTSAVSQTPLAPAPTASPAIATAPNTVATVNPPQGASATTTMNHAPSPYPTPASVPAVPVEPAISAIETSDPSSEPAQKKLKQEVIALAAAEVAAPVQAPSAS